MSGIIKSEHEKKEVDSVGGKKIFLSPAYLLPLEKGLYGLFRNLEVEEEGQREKLKTIGPIKTLRPANLPDEEQLVVIRTTDENQKMICLVEVQG